MKIIAVRQRKPPQAIPPAIEASFQAWVASRPESVKRLIAEFPPGTEIATDEGIFYLIGYNEDDGIIVSPLRPYDDLDAAKALKHYICASHLREARVTR